MPHRGDWRNRGPLPGRDRRHVAVGDDRPRTQPVVSTATRGLTRDTVMAAGNPQLASRLFARKSIESLQREAQTHGLKRTLGPFNLMFLGVGCIIGAGVYVMTGNAAAYFAGPGIILSFVIAGSACALTGLCYAELASTMPVSGSSYTYCYAALGEVFAWVLACLLVLEYGLAVFTLAGAFSGYFASLLQGLGVVISPSLVTPPSKLRPVRVPG